MLATTRWSDPRDVRRRICEVIEIGRGDDRASRLFDAAIVSLILLNIAAFVAETVPQVRAAWATWFDAFEALSVFIFTVECALRIWTAVEVPFLARMPAWKARLHFAGRPSQIIDLLAILPFYLGPLLATDLRVLRVLRLLRFFKLSRYSPALHTLERVLANERRSLTGAGLLLVAALLLTSTGMHYIEGSVQPDKFGSVPNAAYWAMTTLTTVGYGDVSPITPLGKLWAMLTMLTGLCILALPVAIIATGFAQEVGRHDFVVTWSLMSRIPIFAELEANQVAQIMPLLQAHNLPPNMEIIAPGSSSSAMFFIASGKVRMTCGGEHREYGTGEFFGTVAPAANERMPVQFTTQARCRLLKLFREDFSPPRAPASSHRQAHPQGRSGRRAFSGRMTAAARPKTA
jgi:voltage-gated potassium channel